MEGCDCVLVGDSTPDDAAVAAADVAADDVAAADVAG